MTKTQSHISGPTIKSKKEKMHPGQSNRQTGKSEDMRRRCIGIIAPINRQAKPTNLDGHWRRQTKIEILTNIHTDQTWCMWVSVYVRMPFRTWNQEIPKSKSYPGSKTQYPERSSCLEVLYLHSPAEMVRCIDLEKKSWNKQLESSTPNQTWRERRPKNTY